MPNSTESDVDAAGDQLANIATLHVQHVDADAAAHALPLAAELFQLTASLAFTVCA